MKVKILFPLLLLSTLLLQACSSDTELRLASFGGSTMGTSWSVKFTGDPRGGVPALRQELEALLEQVNDEMSTYRPDSILSQYNRAAAGEWVELPEGFARVMRSALAVSEQTAGLFDVTVGPLVNVWGFGPDPDRYQAPGEDEIAAAKQRVGWQRLKLEDNRLYQPGDAYVDLSAIAKGFAVDLLAEAMAARGLVNYMAEIGGDLRTAGQRPGGGDWRIAVEKPIPGVREIKMVLNLNDHALATSGDYRNFFEVDGQMFSHTLDPRTGYPVAHQLASVTVIHENAKMADAYATALVTMGPEQGLAFAKAQELAALLLVRTSEGAEVLLTPAFEPLIARNGEEY